jgi:hypothetical protein
VEPTRQASADVSEEKWQVTGSATGDNADLSDIRSVGSYERTLVIGDGAQNIRMGQ